MREPISVRISNGPYRARFAQGKAGNKCKSPHTSAYSSTSYLEMSKEREDGLDRGVEIVAIRKGSASFVSLSSRNSKHEVVLSTDVHGTRLALEEDILNGTDNNVFVEHTWSFTDVARRLSTAIDVENPKQSAGLTDAIALARLKQIGKNLLTPPYIEPKWQKFLRQFKNWFIVMLFFSGTCTRGCGCVMRVYTSESCVHAW
jgi:hypothetical protein